MLAGTVLSNEHAAVDGADVSIVTVNLLVASFLAGRNCQVLAAFAVLTEVVSARFSVGAVARLEVALCSLSITRIFRTRIIVVADRLVDTCVGALERWVTRVVSADITVVTRLSILFDTSLSGVAGERCACIVEDTVAIEVVTVDHSIFTSARVRVARINRALVVITAIEWGVDALTFHTSVCGALVEVITLDWSESTTTSLGVAGS